MPTTSAMLNAAIDFRSAATAFATQITPADYDRG